MGVKALLLGLRVNPEDEDEAEDTLRLSCNENLCRAASLSSPCKRPPSLSLLPLLVTPERVVVAVLTLVGASAGFSGGCESMFFPSP